MPPANDPFADTAERAGANVPTVHAAPSDVWSRLYQFRDDLEAARDSAGQLRATMRLARLECRADVAFAYAGKAQSILIDAEPGRAPDRDWCETLARALVAAAAPDAHAFAWSSDEAPLMALSPRPAAAAFVRLRPPRLGWLVLASFQPGHRFGEEAMAILRYLARSVFLQQQHVAAAQGLRSSLTGMFKSLIGIVDARDPYTAGHGERVARIARRIGEELELPRVALNDLYLTGLIHDIGTLGVPDDVLLCTGKLTGEQMAQMRRHVLIGDELLASARHVERLRPGVRNHHERWDGKGYPDGLGGDSIPLLARVIAVADACDALMSARRYRPPLSPPQIEAVFRRFAGSQWDPQVVVAFLACRGDVFPPIYQKGIGESAYHALSDVVTAEVERSTLFHPALDDHALRAGRQ
jgi:HD-GYP domain-containing protein (c-di-GMP phosphodiesterase class II)